MLVHTTLGDSKFVDLLRTVCTCNRKTNDALCEENCLQNLNKILAVEEEH